MKSKPKKPNFALVVLLAGVALIVILVLAYFFLDFEGGHIHFGYHPYTASVTAAPITGVVSSNSDRL